MTQGEVPFLHDIKERLRCYLLSAAWRKWPLRHRNSKMLSKKECPRVLQGRMYYATMAYNF